jgi:hypothetical protein
MVNYIAVACRSIALTLCVKNKESPLDTRMVQIPQHTPENLLRDFSFNKPNNNKHFFFLQLTGPIIDKQLKTITETNTNTQKTVNFKDLKSSSLDV